MKRARALTKWFGTMTVLTLLSSCGTAAVNEAALCSATTQATTDHAAALVEDGGPRSLVTGAFLIRQLDAGCAR